MSFLSAIALHILLPVMCSSNMGTKQKTNWPDMLLCFLVLTCFIHVALLAPHRDTHFIAAVFEHRTIAPSGPNKPNWDYAKAIIAQNLDVYEEQLKEAANQVCIKTINVNQTLELDPALIST